MRAGCAAGCCCWRGGSGTRGAAGWRGAGQAGPKPAPACVCERGAVQRAGGRQRRRRRRRERKRKAGAHLGFRGSTVSFGCAGAIMITERRTEQRRASCPSTSRTLLRADPAAAARRWHLVADTLCRESWSADRPTAFVGTERLKPEAKLGAAMPIRSRFQAWAKLWAHEQLAAHVRHMYVPACAAAGAARTHPPLRPPHCPHPPH